MRFAIVKGGIVANIVISDTALDVDWIQSDTARRGDLYNSSTGEFTTPVINSEARRVELWRLKVALHQQGLLDAADAYIATLPRKAQIMWDCAYVIEPTRGMAQSLAVGLGLTNQQMKDIFLSALEVSD